MKHKVTITSATRDVDAAQRRMIKATVQAALEAEAVETPCQINVLLVDDASIRELNARFREIDRATDVLSFPMLDLKPGDKPTEADLEPGERRCALGDMVISLERARAQAEEFGHPLKRELCYLTVHSVLHLLGYDHVDEGEMKAQMRAREEAILETMGIRR